ncbi:MAG TPA: cysteine desulfurase CsdA [Candidatus Omnitrophica bacterium]|nr:MAG: cysteine sulfinate desulfinase [Omnitrophica WOR_2 bacterium GWA2_53_43]HCI44759.1 cysteine desulfurase CsdA [Candidatus Omnitrophota bacterium]
MDLDIQRIRQDFPNLHVSVHGKPLVYFDNAATTFKPRVVLEAMDGYYQKYTSNVHRGVHELSEKATAAYEGARGKVQKFLNARDAKEIIFTRGTTESINLVAYSYGRHSLKPGDEVLISEMEHHSNIVPWQMLREEKGCVLKVIPFNDQGELIYSEFEKLLTAKTKLLSIVYISNSLGTINPVQKMIKAAHGRGALILVDAAQAVGHRRIDVQDLDCDFLAFSGHKLFGPTGVGVLYGKAGLLNKMPPFHGGGDMISSVTFEKTTYNTLPYKFEAGTPAVAEVIGLGAAIDYVLSIGFDRIEACEQGLLEYGTRALQKVPGLRLIGTAKEKVAVLSFILPGVHAHDIGTLVNDEGIAIRTGHHCTQPVMQHFGVPASSRASLSFYNTTAEIDRLVEALLKVREVFP